jgi:hypothetical protein
MGRLVRFLLLNPQVSRLAMAMARAVLVATAQVIAAPLLLRCFRQFLAWLGFGNSDSGGSDVAGSSEDRPEPPELW